MKNIHATAWLRPALLLAALWLVAGCVEKRVVSSSYMGLTPIPTRVQAPPPQPERPSSFPNPFKWIGDGMAGLFGDGNKPAPAKGPGQGVQVPPGYSGQTTFTDNNGKNYKLNYQNGSLVGVEPQGSAAAKP